MRDDVTMPPELTRKPLLVAFAATLGLMTSSPPVVNGPLGLFVVPVTQAFGIGRGTFGLLCGVSMVLGAALTPFAGRAMDRYGVRRLVLPGIVAFGLVQMLLSAVPLSITLLAILLLAQGAASCVATPLAYVKVLSLWFHRRRGIMLGIASAIGIGAGSGICVAIVGGLMAAGGWRLAYLGTGIYVLIVGAAVVLPLLHEPAAVERATGSAAPPDLPGLSLKEALATLPLRLVLVMVFATLGALTIMMGHGPALLAGRGLDIGPFYLGCAAVGSLTGQILSGVLLDRIDSPKVGLIFALATMVGGLVILYFGKSTMVVLPAAVVMGLGQGAETGLASYYVSRFCGLRAYASIFGVVMALITLTAGLFPALAGYVFDRTGSYDALFPLVDLLYAIPPIAILLMPRYRFMAVPIGL